MSGGGNYTFEARPVCVMCGSSARRVIGRRLSRSQGLRPTKLTGISTTVVRCADCGLVYADPIPIPGSIEQHYDVDPESYMAESELAPHSDDFIDKYRSVSGRRNGVRALDIGVGVGFRLGALNEAGFDVHGIEPSPTFYRHALARTGVSADRLLRCSVEEATFEPGSFDLVLFAAVLEHFYDPADAVRRAMGWLKPSGLAYVEVPSARWLTSRLVNAIYRLQGLDYAANLSPLHPPFHLYEFTGRSFAALGRTAGYSVVLERIHATSSYLPRFLDPVVLPVMASTRTGLELEVWLRRNP